MPYGICHMSIVPVRILKDDTSEMRTQLLYGDHFKILESRKKWSKIKIAFDRTEGWIHNNQFTSISKQEFEQLNSKDSSKYVSDLVSYVTTRDDILVPLVLGSSVSALQMLSHSFDGAYLNGDGNKSNLVQTALCYLNAPFLWGGKSPFGIDSSGFTQMVYKINGFALLRYAHEQATQGEALSFIEESEAGDLAFFDNKEGVIDHVGLILKNNSIIHVHGKVRIDKLDHTGIFDTNARTYSHKLRVIKKVT